METKNISISKLEINKGQVEGLPQNPRFIRDNRYEQLKKSIEDAPEMLSLRELIVYPHGKKYVVIAGNMRLRACKDLGYTDVPCKVLPEDTPVEKLREYTIKDNNGFGQDDWDILANEWDEVELADWGMELPPDWGKEDEGDGIDVGKTVSQASSDNSIKEYSEDTNYDLNRLYRSRINKDIKSRIDDGVKSGKIRSEIAEVLNTRATQCSVFNFDEIIKYYRSEDATAEEKELLRRLYLVFVAPKELIEDAILKVRETTKEIFDDELMSKGGDDGGEED